MKFAYQRYEVLPSATVPTGILYRPEIPIRLIGLCGAVTILALADTGADETPLPRSIGELIGAAIEETQSWTVSGIGGQKVAVFLAEVAFELVAHRKMHRWRARVGLVDYGNPANEAAVLGHIGFFDHFTAHFNTRRRVATVNAYR